MSSDLGLLELSEYTTGNGIIWIHRWKMGLTEYIAGKCDYLNTPLENGIDWKNRDKMGLSEYTTWKWDYLKETQGIWDNLNTPRGKWDYLNTTRENGINWKNRGKMGLSEYMAREWFKSVRTILLGYTTGIIRVRWDNSHFICMPFIAHMILPYQRMHVISLTWRRKNSAVKCL